MFIKAIGLKFGINQLLLWGCDLDDAWLGTLHRHTSPDSDGGTSPYVVHSDGKHIMEFDGLFICENREVGSDLDLYQKVIRKWISHKKYVFAPGYTTVPKSDLRLDTRLFLYGEVCNVQEIYAIKGSSPIIQNVGFWNGSGLEVAMGEIWERRRDLRGTVLAATYPPAQNVPPVMRYFRISHCPTGLHNLSSADSSGRLNS